MGTSRRYFGCSKVMVVYVKYFRILIVFFTFAQMLLSFLFHKFGNLFFFLEERSEVAPVNSLVSQGGDEDLLVSVGIFLFFFVAVFFLVRLKSKVGATDILALFAVLAIQAVSLTMVEVASFPISIAQPNGWILQAWLGCYVCLWALLLAFSVGKIVFATFSSSD